MADPEFSVLLPTHDRADVLGYAIQSILAQSIGSFELLIVGDGCAGTTADVVRRFDDRRIKWFDLPKAPLSGYANRNLVLRQATGRIIAYAQDDDLWFPDHLELLRAALDSAGAQWAYSRPLWVGPDGVICPSAVNLTLSDELTHFLTVENDVPSSSVIHLRTALQRIGYWPEDTPRLADWITWRRIIGRAGANPVAYCPIPTSLHFRASWRDYDSVVEHAWRPLAQQPWWPPVLNNPAGTDSEQAVIRHAMTNGDRWIERVREATQTVLDRMAWHAIRKLPPLIETAQAGRAAAEAQLQQLRESSAAISAALESQLYAARQAVSTAQARATSAEQAARTAETDLQRLRESSAASLADLELQSATALRAGRSALSHANAQAADDRAALARMRASTIWRATAPVRTAVDALRKLAPRPAARSR